MASSALYQPSTAPAPISLLSGASGSACPFTVFMYNSNVLLAPPRS